MTNNTFEMFKWVASFTRESPNDPRESFDANAYLQRIHHGLARSDREQQKITSSDWRNSKQCTWIKPENLFYRPRTMYTKCTFPSDK